MPEGTVRGSTAPESSGRPAGERRGAEPGSARPNNEHIVLVNLVTQSSLQSVSTPIEPSRT